MASKSGRCARCGAELEPGSTCSICGFGPASKAGPAGKTFAELLIGRTIAGFALGELIGSGERGAVFHATRLSDGNGAFAIKVLPHGRSRPRLQDRLLESARKALGVRHASLATLVEVGTDESLGVAYLVSELAPGSDLARRIASSGALPLAEAAFIGAAAAEALGALHAAGALHRDVKPAHILVDAHSTVRLVETGFPPIIASDPGHGETARAPVVGSPCYAAPEQSRDPESATGASDVYSLGATLFHLIAGRPPFVAESPVALLVQHATRPAPALRSLIPEAPEELARLVDAMLAKDPSSRPSREEIVATLRPLAEAVTDSTRPYRRSRFAASRLRRDAELARKVLALGLATRSALEEVLKATYRSAVRLPTSMLCGACEDFAEALVERGIVRTQVLAKLKEEVEKAEARRRDAAWGRFAIEAHFATRADIERVLAETGDTFSSLAESMVKHGAISSENAEAVSKASARHLREVDAAAIERAARARGVSTASLEAAHRTLLELPEGDGRSLLDLLVESGEIPEELAWEIARDVVLASISQ